jgi:hypothetical protein
MEPAVGLAHAYDEGQKFSRFHTWLAGALTD